MSIETVSVFRNINSAAMNIHVKKCGVLELTHTGSWEHIVKFSGILNQLHKTTIKN